TNVVLHVPNLIQDSVRERCFESHDLDVFGEIISGCALKNGSATSIHIVSIPYDLIARHEELLGHSDLGTTMIYTHTVQSVTLKEAKSPLNF
ncbi:MAG: hypothetical protein ACRD2L_25535, partial [Terriglobia bacterium]